MQVSQYFRLRGIVFYFIRFDHSWAGYRYERSRNAKVGFNAFFSLLDDSFILAIGELCNTAFRKLRHDTAYEFRSLARIVQDRLQDLVVDVLTKPTESGETIR